MGKNESALPLLQKFIYILNAMENAGQSRSPALNGYGDKRIVVLEYVDSLERRCRELEVALAPFAAPPEICEHSGPCVDYVRAYAALAAGEKGASDAK